MFDQESDRIEIIARQLAQAKELSSAKEYERAKTLLETVDDPVAKTWLAKINTILAKEKRARSEATSLEFYRNQMAAKLDVSDGRSYLIVCPNCKGESTQMVDLQRVDHYFSCPNCHVNFMTSLFTIRASRSNSPSGIGRDYSVRVISASGQENLINFLTLGVEKIELRSRDLAGFTYLENRLMVIQNLTIGQYWRIGWVRAKSSPLLIAFLIGLILIFALFYLYVTYFRWQ